MGIKSEQVSPYIILCGDFNHRDVLEAIGDYPDVIVRNVGNTKAGANLDLCATNFDDQIIKTINHPPLQSNDD